MRRSLVLLVVLGAALSFVLAQVYVPPIAVERLAVWVTQTLSLGGSWGPRLQQALTYVASVVAGVFLGRTLDYRQYVASGVERQVLESAAEPLADAVGQAGVDWNPDEQAVLALVRPEESGVFGYWNLVLARDVVYRAGGVGTGSSLEVARERALEAYRQWVAGIWPLMDWLPELARLDGFWTPEVGEFSNEWGTYYYEAPEALQRGPISRVSGSNLLLEVREAPPVIVEYPPHWTGVEWQYRVWAVPAYIYRVYRVYATYEVGIDADWCYSDGTAEVAGYWLVRYDFDRWDYVFERPFYRAAAAGQFGGAIAYSGSFPRPDGRLWRYSVYRLYGSASGALVEAAGVIGQIGMAWARICAGRLAGLEVGRLPWDDSQDDFGVAVRQRDGALVWWLVRPVEALREAFVPRVGLAERFARISAYAADRFPWSVYHALRVPALGEVEVNVPCFEVGNNRRLCPNESVVQLAATASRAGFGLLLVVGVGVWLGRRVTPWLRL